MVEAEDTHGGDAKQEKMALAKVDTIKVENTLGDKSRGRGHSVTKN